jgi:FAD/FMN-containing dehydrogenase
LLGLGIDNMISARLVTAEGKLINVSATENSDLWWGLRGAGHGFGIITKLTIRTHPEFNGGQHWVSNLIFTPDKIDIISEAVNGLDWDQGMAIHMFMMNAPPEMKANIPGIKSWYNVYWLTTIQPIILISCWYPGAEEPARKAFASLLSAGPIMEQSEMTPYNLINAGADNFGIKGGAKPGASTSFMKFKPSVLREIWDLVTGFLGKYPQAAQTTVLFELYSVKKVEEVGDDETAFPHRHTPFHG